MRINDPLIGSPQMASSGLLAGTIDCVCVLRSEEVVSAFIIPGTTAKVISVGGSAEGQRQAGIQR